MRKLLILFAGLLMLVPAVGWAQLNTNTLPPECARASMVAGSCTPLRQGVRVRASSSTAGDCETDGGDVVLCEYDGSNWIAVLPGLYGGGDIEIATDEAATFGAPNAMLQTTLATGFALHNQFEGIPKLNVTNIALLIDGPTIGVTATDTLIASCAVIVAGTELDDATTFVTGAASYEYTGAAVAAVGDGFDCDIGAFPAVNMDSVGFWFRSSVALVAGDLIINLKDTEVDDAAAIDFPAITVVDEWQWIEIDVNTECAAAACDGVDGFEVVIAANAATFNLAVLNLDHLGMWLDTAEQAIGNIRVGGLIDFSYTLIAQDQANTHVQGVEWTSHFPHYQTGADAILVITDLSAYYGTTLEALE